MKRLITLCILSIVALAITAQSMAGDAGQCDGHVQCPSCRHVCKLSCEKVNEEKHCWEVECKPICIPRVKFPWEKCCTPPKCAKLKYVHVLKKVDYECPSCKYVWTPVCKSCSNCNDKSDAKNDDYGDVHAVAPKVLTQSR